MRSKIYVSLAAMLPCACVTTHQGVEVSPNSNAYSISCARNPEIQSDYFTALSFTVENKIDQWQEFKVNSVEWQPASAIAIASPNDIRDFSAAYAVKAKADKYNRDLFLSSLIVGGGIAMLAGGKNEGLIGAGTILGASGVAVGDDVKKSHDNSQYAGLGFSSNHLMASEGFRVPPGLYVRKTLLVQTKPGVALPRSARVCFTQPLTDCLDVPVQVGSMR